MITILKQIPFFATLDKELHETIIKNIEMQYYPKSYTLFKEGDEGDKMYIIKNGKVEITMEQAEKNPIATLSTNDFFGEMALVSNDPRNATAKTLEDSEIFVLHKDVFQELMRINPEIATQISNEIIHRVNENDQKLGNKNDSSNSSSLFN